ncbi:MAG: hypothetical protein ABIO02_04230, partial [Patescibacteria group bacterium]
MPRRHRRTSAPSVKGKSNRALYIVGFLMVCIILLTTLVNSFKKTLFFTKKDRINLVFYNDRTTFYSLGINTEGEYLISFPADLKMEIPGGYGSYRIGALGKLVSLEKKPELIQNTFSLATYSFVDYYFYQNTSDVYYGSEENESLPSPKMIWSSRSNVGVLDKLYLIFYFINKKPQDFHNVPLHSEENKEGENIFSAGEFEKRITGYLFQQSYRNERKSVQIMYADNYVNADRVGKMLEGNGIRVGDISHDGSLVRGCIVQEDSVSHSLTAKALVDVFHCKWKKGKTDIYDILFMLG